MAADVFAYAADDGGTPVAGVRFSLHSVDGALLQADTTDAEGLAFLGNRAAGAYVIRATPAAGYLPVTPRTAATVIDSADPLVFDHVVLPVALPQSSDPNFCLCTGRFVLPDGTPIPRGEVSFRVELTGPDLLVGADGVPVGFSKGRTVHCPIVDGYGQVALPRNAVVYVDMPTSGDSILGWESKVPNLPAAHLPDVVFPTIRSVQWYADDVPVLPVSDPELALGVGDTKTVSLAYVYRSGALVEGRVSLGVHPSISVLCDEDGIHVTGVAAGEEDIMSSVHDLQESTAGFNVQPSQSVIGASLRIVVS